MEKIINLSFTKEHPIIGNHTVYGNSVLPGLAYIDLLYQLAREVIGIEYYTHSLNHLTIYNPMLIDEKSSVHLKVVFKQSNHHWKVKITGVENGLEANEGILKTYIKAEFHPKHVSVEGQKDLFHLKNNTNKVVDLNEVYNSAQKKGLVHQGIIKARGKVYITDQNCLVEVKMDDEFLVEAEGFIFSPTLLDGAAMAWGEIESRIGSNDNTDLFLPLYFESFSCSKALKTNCYAIIEHSSLSQANDILTMDMELYNSKGIKVGTLKKMTAKKVRDINHFTTDSDVENHTPDFGFNEIANDETEIGCEGIIRKVLSKYMDELAYQIELDAGFFESGLESQQLLRLVNDLEDTLQLSLSPTLLFEYSNLKELVGYLDNLLDCRVLEMMQKKDEEEPISAKPRSIMNQYMFYGNERFLHDHLVYGQPALMGVTHPCLAIESLLAQSEISWPLELRNIIFQGGPVTLEDNETATVKVEFEEKNNRATFKTHFFVDNPANLKTCCSGEYIGAINESVERLNIKGLIEQSKPLNNDAVIRWYEAFNNFKIGPMLEVIKSAYQYDKLTTISHACLEWKEKKGDQVDFSFDPLLLNACFLMNNDLKFETKDSIYVPFTIEKIKIYNKLSNNVYIIKKSRFEKPDFHSFDALITNQDGVILAEIINASLKEATNPQKLENASFPLSSLQIKREKMEVEQGAEMPLDIAIVGVSGRYPMAYDIEDFWLKLASGKNCISEIPKERWNWEGLFTSDLSEVGRIHSKWGGFIEDVDRFDSRFFNISQREAELMDPQERLYLEHCWMALEDAGYTKEMLGSDSAIRSQVGVYVGVMHHEYPLLAAESTIDGNRIGIGGAASSIATRVSYFFDFSGPSMVVDTMCSSSMSAVYLACQALKGKQIDAALIGGVNLSLHPSKYLMLSQRHFISPKGRCASFGEDGDGYIPGEGVGVLFLKRLEDAIRDKDHIYAVIKGAAINHGGRSGGYTVPNIKSQSDVISKAIVESQIDPKSITYIEAHGTGTKLGDPIEIQGLKNAFEEFTDQKQYCWIGSVKSNIGHCEAAAGVAGITKVLNQMRYGKIAPTLHSRVVNPEINLADTPFMLNHELRNWERPVIEGEVQPRRAGISSFGAGGTNTHLIIEEYMKHVPEQPNSSVQMKPVIIVLSAKSKWSLKKNAEKLVDAIHRDKFSNLDLVDMAYTLQIGRNAMKYRLAIIVESLEKLKEKLQSFINGHQEIPDLFIGKIERMIDKELTINYLIDSYDKICEYWVSGNNVKWENLYNGLTPNRISLPTYSFERVLCWIPNESNTSSTIQPTIIHPLLNSNNLNFMEQRFTSALTGQEFFLLDHRINGQKVLPGAVYIEMVRAAVAYSTCITGNQRIELKKIIWKHPLVVNDQPERVSLSLYPEQEGGIRFEVNQESDNQTNQVLAQGQAILMEDHLSPAMDMEEIKKECSKQKVVSADEYYKAFKEIGIEYGPSFQGITTVWLGNNMALAELKLPVNDSSVTNAYYLHPSMLDAAFQTLFSMINSSGTPKPSVPFLLQNIRIFRETASMKWAYIRYSEGSSEEDKMRKFDIDLLDDEGNVGVQIRGISTRELEDRIKKEELQQSSETLLLQPVWIEHNVTEHEENIIYDRQIVLLSQELESVVGDMQAEIPHADCRVLKASSINVEERFTAYAEETFEIIKSIARENSREKILLQFVFSNAEKLAAGLSGLLKTAQLENPSLTAQLIEVDRKESMTEVVKENRNSVENQVRYQDGIRYVSRLNEISAEEDQGAIPWKDNGVYVITGGTGGLGLIFAKEIARKVKKPVLILSSRTPNKASVRERIKELEENGAKVVLKET
ncbi:polyketide synthase dehydratase domain-containing protein, partial [Paenibacillus alba]|uniref:beta-ketoacyl synthase N-terminal-like domain-containing protein n=1 Tax=Paenibacillus alba TaxID=1197127 RepID=UPI0015637DA1